MTYDIQRDCCSSRTCRDVILYQQRSWDDIKTCIMFCDIVQYDCNLFGCKLVNFYQTTIDGEINLAIEIVIVKITVLLLILKITKVLYLTNKLYFIIFRKIIV